MGAEGVSARIRTCGAVQLNGGADGAPSAYESADISAVDSLQPSGMSRSVHEVADGSAGVYDGAVQCRGTSETTERLAPRWLWK